MSLKVRSVLQDPGYGSVRDICASLGYNSEAKSDRHFKYLSMKTASYRKDFMRKSPFLTDFPLSDVAPEVQVCASQFMEQHQRLFQDSNEARAFRWPTYPSDNSKILSGLAKLMCAQEYLRQKNAREKSKEKARRDTDTDEPFPVDLTPPQSVSSVGGKQVAAAVGASIYDEPFMSQGSSDDEEDVEELQRNVDIHLDYVYPLTNVPDGKASAWLFNSDKCPDDVEPFAFRYLHENNLYNSKAENIDAIYKFCEALKQHLDVECEQSKDHKIYKRCEQLVQRAARRWDTGGYRFLTKKSGVLKKTPIFEHAWMLHRSKWINEMNSGVTDASLEIPSAFQSKPFMPLLMPHLASKKRPAEAMGGASPSRDPKEAPPQRKTDQILTAPQLSATRETDQTAASSYTQPVNTRAPEAVMINSLQANQDSKLSDYAPFNPVFADGAGLAEPVVMPPSTILVDKCPSSLRQPSVYDESRAFGLPGSHHQVPYDVDSPPTLKFEPISPSHDAVELLHHGFPGPGTSINSESRAFQPFDNRDTPALERPKLYFAIENARGMPDTTPSQLVSGPTFRDSSLAAFFDLVASRSNKATASLSDITLRYTWINQNAVVVNRLIGEEAWEDIKEDVLEFFRMSREDDSTRRRFHIWVRTGDTTKVGKSASRDDI